MAGIGIAISPAAETAGSCNHKTVSPTGIFNAPAEAGKTRFRNSAALIILGVVTEETMVAAEALSNRAGLFNNHREATHHVAAAVMAPVSPGLQVAEIFRDLRAATTATAVAVRLVAVAVLPVEVMAALEDIKK